MSKALEKETKSKEKLLGKIICAFFFPTVLCLVFCMIKGVSVFSLYAPSCTYNDGLMYYKVVDGIRAYGMPQGYFGYNESHAMIGNLAAWSPIIYVPWTLWAALFGWSFTSVIISNLFFVSVSLAIFVALTHLKWSSLILFFLILLCFPSTPTYLLVTMPEAMILSMLILYLGVAYYLFSGGTRKKTAVAAMFIIAIILTLLRPYMVLFLLLPGYAMRARKLVAAMTTLVLMILSLVGYSILSRYFTCEFIKPLYDDTILRLFSGGKFTEIYRFAKRTFGWIYPQLANNMMKNAFAFGYGAGIQYVVVFVATAGSILLGIKKNNRLRPIFIVYAISILALLSAIILLYQEVHESSRHLWGLAVMGILLLFLAEDGVLANIFQILILGLMVFFAYKGSFHSLDYDIATQKPSLKTTITEWEEIYDNSGMAVIPRADGYENTVIWALGDIIDGEIVNTEYRELYSLPAGMGINCCTTGYILDHFTELQSRYLAIPAGGGSIDSLCREAGWAEIGHSAEVVIYRRPD